MGRERMKRKKEPDLAAELEERFARWDEVYQNGCSDPMWSDGVNLDLVRSHIIYTKRQLEESIGDGAYPDIYYRDTPPEVDMDYMARADEIRANARITLAVYQSDPHYLYCKKHAPQLSAKELKRFPVENVLHYVFGLEEAIAGDDLIFMRRHESAGWYSRSFERCEQEIRQMISDRELNPQMSLFSVLEPEPDDNYEDEDECCLQNMF